MIETILVIAALVLCAEMALSHHKYAEILQSLNLESAVTPPNGWIYRLVHPFVMAARALTHN